MMERPEIAGTIYDHLVCFGSEGRITLTGDSLGLLGEYIQELEYEVARLQREAEKGQRLRQVYEYVRRNGYLATPEGLTELEEAFRSGER